MSFTKFLINNLQIKNKLSKSEVLSPTFNILNEYRVKNINIKHIDLYRIKNKEEADNLGLFEESDAVKIIDRGASKKIIHKNKAANKKSNLYKFVNNLK